jgi:hypothetical protein
VVAQQGRDIQFVDEDCVVKVKNGYSRIYGCFTTDILVIPHQNNPHGSEQRVVFDEHGNELYNQWHEK